MNNALATALSAAVPLRIMELEQRGGPDDADLRAAREFSRVLAEKGDTILFRSKNKGETTDLFNRLARAIAVLAFCPGGVRLFGQHWLAGEHNRNQRGTP